MANDTLSKLKEAASLLPTTPGVYRFFDASDKIIYVGKAVNLRRRVSSYFIGIERHAAKVRVMVGKIARLEHIDTPTENDALLLENSLIKTLRPRYNILLKDDKTYPWIVVRNEHFPRIESTRRLIRDGSQYFGPYSSVLSQRAMLEFVREIYQVRTCRLNLSPEAIARGRYKVCLQYHLGNCKGPCEGRQTEEEYKQTVDMVKRHLKGDLRATRRFLEEQMNSAAAQLNYEQAAEYKSRLASLDKYAAKSVIVSDRLGDMDVFSIITEQSEAYCNFVRVSKGTVIASQTVELSVGAESDPATILTYAIRQIVAEISGSLAHEVVVPFMPDDTFEGVKFTVPERGDKLQLLEFSQRSARLFHAERLKNMEIRNPEKRTERLLAAMQRELHLPREPRHIECFDNSNLQGTHPVASCVVFRNCRPSRKEYRHFNIKTVVGADDFASMREIVRRRYTRLVAEGAELPDLIIVDGGKGQLSSAFSVLQELGLDGKIPVVGLAKRIEEIYFPADPQPYYLQRTGEPLKVIMHLRDEAHRFGITFHRNKRSSDFIVTELSAIEGVGPKTTDALLTRFGSVAGVKKASLEELSGEVGQSKAARIFFYFHK